MAFMHTIGVRCMFVGWGYIQCTCTRAFKCLCILNLRYADAAKRYAVSLLVHNIDECMHSMCIADGVHWVGERVITASKTVSAFILEYQPHISTAQKFMSL